MATSVLGVAKLNDNYIRTSLPPSKEQNKQVTYEVQLKAWWRDQFSSSADPTKVVSKITVTDDQTGEVLAQGSTLPLKFKLQGKALSSPCPTPVMEQLSQDPECIPHLGAFRVAAEMAGEEQETPASGATIPVAAFYEDLFRQDTGCTWRGWIPLADPRKFGFSETTEKENDKKGNGFAIQKVICLISNMREFPLRMDVSLAVCEPKPQAMMLPNRVSPHLPPNAQFQLDNGPAYGERLFDELHNNNTLYEGLMGRQSQRKASGGFTPGGFWASSGSIKA